jgi:signal transduction histidine kinase
MGAMVWWQYTHEKMYRTNQIRQQLEFINARVIKAYETDFNLLPFLSFLSDYYIANPIYDDIRLSVYNATNGDLIYNVGIPVKFKERDRRAMHNKQIARTTVYNSADAKGYFYYAVDFSPDKKLVVYTALPYDANVVEALKPDNRLWIILFVLTVVVTAFSYVTSRYLGKSVTLLSNFAKYAAADDPRYAQDENFPHDELGTIAEQIVHIYNGRMEAIKQMEEEHKIAINSIVEKNRVKRQLTNNINHELKTPIGIIKGYVDTMVENPDMDEATRTRFLTKTQENVTRLTNLVTDISTITRLEEAEQMITTERVDYHEVVFTVAEEVVLAGIGPNMKFIHKVPMNCYVNGNFSLLQAMLHNLIKNAIHHSQGTEYGIKLIGEDDKFYKFCFYDNGQGVGEEHLPHLFERFYRVDSGRTRKEGGTGLGLPIVQNTIIAHRGTISLSNRPEGGLQFIYTLPKYVKSEEKA